MVRRVGNLVASLGPFQGNSGDEDDSKRDPFLGTLLNVLALSSLILGLFVLPFDEYLRGVMGGVLNSYRSLRDIVFAGIGSPIADLINVIGEWLTWLPAAPWFRIHPAIKDIITLYLISGAALVRTREEMRFGSISKPWGAIGTFLLWPYPVYRVARLLIYWIDQYPGFSSFGFNTQRTPRENSSMNGRGMVRNMLLRESCSSPRGQLKS